MQTRSFDSASPLFLGQYLLKEKLPSGIPNPKNILPGHMTPHQTTIYRIAIHCLLYIYVNICLPTHIHNILKYSLVCREKYSSARRSRQPRGSIVQLCLIPMACYFRIFIYIYIYIDLHHTYLITYRYNMLHIHNHCRALLPIAFCGRIPFIWNGIRSMRLLPLTFIWLGKINIIVPSVRDRRYSTDPQYTPVHLKT